MQRQYFALGGKGALLQRRETLADDNLGLGNVLEVVLGHLQMNVLCDGLAVVAENVVQLLVSFQVSPEMRDSLTG